METLKAQADTPRARAIVADDHAIVRTGLRQVLDSLTITVVEEAENGFEAVAGVKQHAPEVVLLDISMPHSQGTEVVHEIRRWCPAAKIVVYTGVTNPAVLAALIESNVDGLFLKGSDLTELAQQLPLILQGAQYVAIAVSELLTAPSPLADLTAREAQVATMLISGKNNREIADYLRISPKTVDKHRSNLMAKLDLHSFVELMQFALKYDLVGSDANEI